MKSLAETIASTSPAALGGRWAKYLALTIALGHVDEIGRVRASQATLRAATGLSRSTVQRAMAELRRHGWLHDDEVLRLGPWAAPTPPVWEPMGTPGIPRTWSLVALRP